MSAAALALAVRAAACHAKVRGPWLPPCRTILVEPTPFTAWCTIRECYPAKHAESVLFDPLPHKEIPMPTPPLDDDEMPNNLLATGALWAVLDGLAPSSAVAVSIEGGNRLLIHFSFLKSPYRLTVERVDEELGG